MKTLSDGSVCRTVITGQRASLLPRPLFPQRELTQATLPPAVPLQRAPSLFQSAAKMIKETMDKKFGSSWHVVIGEGFGFEITHEVKNLLYLYFGGTLAVCVWKCS